MIDAFGIAATRISVERVLAAQGKRSPGHPFRSAEDFAPYWAEADSLCTGADLALCVAAEMPLGAYGRSDYVFASAATLGDALEAFRRDTMRAVGGFEIQLSIRARRAELRAIAPPPMAPIVEILVALVALRLQRLVEPATDILAVQLPRSAPRDPAQWRAHYTVRPRFGTPHGLLAVPAHALRRRLRTSNVTVRAALGVETGASTANDVRNYVRGWIREPLEAEAVARALGMSLRTLQRKLGDEGVTLRDLVLDTRIDIARQLLANERLSVSQVGAAVGFRRLSAFSRAYFERTGVRPSAVRA